MKTRIYFLMFGVFFSGLANAQHDFDTQGILFSNSTNNVLTLGSNTVQAQYTSATSVFEIYSPTEASYLHLKAGSNSLFISNSIQYGNFILAPTNHPFSIGVGNNVLTPQLRLQTNGNVAIGTALNPTDYKLAVGGKIIAEELKVQLQSAPWPDYVFANDYSLPSLQEVEKQIQENGHLENIPSACEVQENGIEVGEMNRLLLEKVEELTLYTINQQKQLDQQTKEMEELKALVNTLVQKNK